MNLNDFQFKTAKFYGEQKVLVSSELKFFLTKWIIGEGVQMFTYIRTTFNSEIVYS